MAFYVKKPIPVEAHPWDGTFNFNPTPGFRPIFEVKYVMTGKKGLKTLEGVMDIEVGSYIVKGPYGEYWAVRKDIFEETYQDITQLR